MMPITLMEETMQRIDAHIHYFGDHPENIALFEKYNLKLFNVCVAHGVNSLWRERAKVYQQLVRDYPQHYAWCTTFDPPAFDDQDYAERVIAELEQDFNAGAVACKFWKNIGMDIRKPDGTFLMIDDPIFAPIYKYLIAVGKPALMHIAEPLECWQPLDENGVHYGYYSQHPEWHMYNKPDYPSHQALMDARDHVLDLYPDLRLVGAHLGSLEYDVAEIAKRLDRYPNFAVDTSARLKDLAVQDSATVRQFFLDYEDRILFGTDIVQRLSIAAMSADERTHHLQAVQHKYETEFAYYESVNTVTIQGREVQGLGLPRNVLEKLYAINAQSWFPGI